MQGKLGTLTIGQAPRPDITPVLDAALGDAIERIDAGVLDGLSREEIAAGFAPKPGGGLLVTRLADGSSVTIDKAATEAGALKRIADLEAQGCSAILMLCTGAFHSLRTKSAWLIEPDHILPQAVAALVGQRQLGILVPVVEQIASEAEKWAPLARPPICAAAHPYTAGEAELAAASRDLRARGAQVLLLDCMGFTESHRAVAREASGLPVIVSNALVAKLASEVL